MRVASRSIRIGSPNGEGVGVPLVLEETSPEAAHPAPSASLRAAVASVVRLQREIGPFA